jgi:hypothetical protein
MAHEGIAARGGAPATGGLAGVVWLIGWLFTAGFAKLIWWKIILGLLVRPRVEIMEC